MGQNKTKIFGIIVAIFVIFTIIGIAYESTTGLNMLTGEKKTSGVGADKWTEEESSAPTVSTPIPTITSKPVCDSSYPDFCIPSGPPDLNCGDIPQKRFTVLQPDPHDFDRDNDGIGCES